MLGTIEIFPNLPTWSPEEFFGGAERGGYFVLTDASTLFQDAASSIPVTAIGQPIGRATTPVGGMDIQTSNAATRPVFEGPNGALYDGVDDLLQSVLAANWGPFSTVAAKVIMSPGTTTNVSNIASVNQATGFFVVAGVLRNTQRAQGTARSTATGQATAGLPNNSLPTGAAQSIIVWSTETGVIAQTAAGESAEAPFPTPPLVAFTNANIRSGVTSAAGVGTAQMNLLELLVIDRELSAAERQQLLDFWG